MTTALAESFQCAGDPEVCRIEGGLWMVPHGRHSPSFMLWPLNSLRSGNWSAWMQSTKQSKALQRG
eukprot:scaffold625_cov324-Pavlova_lutheri.AAC.57